MKKFMLFAVAFAVLAGTLAFYGCGSKSTTGPTPAAAVIKDPSVWTQVTQTTPFTATDWNTTYVYNNKMWVVAGRKSGGATIAEVWNSANGADWTMVTGNAAFGPRFRHAGVVFNNKMWVMAGTPLSGNCATPINDVWYSSNGADWTLATGNAQFAPRFNPRAFNFNGKMWIAGGIDDTCGYLNDVWSSTNGVTWTKVTATAAFSPRHTFGVTVCNNKMWIIGGYDNQPGKNYYGQFYSGEDNDVWSSGNGVDWASVTGNAGFSPRTGLTVFSDGSRLYAGMGYDDNISGNLNDDLWYSTDGKLWTLATQALTGAGRMRADAIVYNGKVWIIGGSTCSSSSTCVTNEVWSSH